MNRKIVADLGGFIKMRYGVEFEDNIKLLTHFVKLVEEIDRSVLDTYFGWDQSKGTEGGYWTQQIKFDTRRTGRQMVEYINSLNPTSILDVGCGDNEFKKFWNEKLTGIDPFNNKSDIKVSIEDFNPGKTFDVVMLLGSVNFGDETTILKQVAKAVKLCKPGGKLFLRVNPGITHDHDKARWIDFFEWNEEIIQKFAKQLNCTVEEIAWDHTEEETIRWGNRLYSEWTRNPFQTKQ
jgi:SAM-dependent methyltransferase